MRVLIDECIERLRHSFRGHDCQTVRYAGFGGLKNGNLLDAAEAAGFEVLLTVDKGLAYEQNLVGRRIAVVILHAKSVLREDLLLCVPECLALLQTIKPGEIARVVLGS